jgi:hypothetical protein
MALNLVFKGQVEEDHERTRKSGIDEGRGRTGKVSRKRRKQNLRSTSNCSRDNRGIQIE